MQRRTTEETHARAGLASGKARRAALRERDLDWRARMDGGETLSAIARTDGVNKSTVMRAVARIPEGAGRCVNGNPAVGGRTQPAAFVARTEVTEATRRAAEQERARIKAAAALAVARLRERYRMMVT